MYNETGILNIISPQDVKTKPNLTTENIAMTHLIFPNNYSTITTNSLF